MGVFLRKKDLRNYKIYESTEQFWFMIWSDHICLIYWKGNRTTAYMPTYNRMKAAWLSRFSYFKAYIKPTWSLHDAYMLLGVFSKEARMK